MLREFVGGDEFVPLMGAARQPAQYIFGADDRQRKALPVAVQGRDHHQPARLEHRRAAVEEDADIRHVLDHFHRQHNVEALAHVHLFSRGAAIVDRQMALVGMQLGGRDIGGGWIDPDHLRAQPRERLAQQAGAAADIEDAQSGKAIQAFDVALELAAGGVADIGQPQRIDLVQRGHLALGVPPLVRQFRELRDFGRIDRAARYAGVI